MRRNILQWLEGTMEDATSAIILTHNIDFLFLQSIVLPRFRAIGFPKVTIFADAMCASAAFAQQHMLLSGIGRQCRVIPVDMGTGRRFHPKAIFLSGPTKAALAVGSGNLTHGGWSANHEIWSTVETDLDDGAQIAAFRQYIDVIKQLVNQDPFLEEELSDAFDGETKNWMESLVPPAGLIGSPNVQTVLDRIAEAVAEDVTAISVVSPYFDPDGEALSTIANRWPVPVRVLMQKNAPGLSSSSNAAQPGNVSIIPVATDPSRFIHAKAYFFERSEGATLVSGSANTSRAALLSSEAWGNAELVAVQQLSSDDKQELLDELIVQDGSIEFPNDPPSDEWEIDEPALKIISARYLDGTVSISLKLEQPIAKILVTLNDGTEREVSKGPGEGSFVFSVPKAPKSLTATVVYVDGQSETSMPIWVTDEGALGEPVPARRINAKIESSIEDGALSARGMIEIMGLLRDHALTPESGGQRGAERDRTAVNGRVETYSLDDVFSDDFGSPVTWMSGPSMPGFSETDFLRAFSNYFSLTPEGGDDGTLSDGVAEEANAAEVDELEAATREAADLEQKRQERKKNRKEEAERLRNRMVNTIQGVSQAFASEEFIKGRSIERVSADIRAAALLLRKGVDDGILFKDDFIAATNDLWRILFFGGKDELSVLQRLVESGAEGEELDINNAIASPSLSAALVLWSAPNWALQDRDAASFRFSAMLLASEFPFLVDGGSSDEVARELTRLSRAMGSDLSAASLFETWVNWLRAGMAFTELKKCVEGVSQKELAARVSGGDVKAGELLWQAGDFYVSTTDVSRKPGKKCVVRSIRGGDDKKYTGEFLAPILRLIESEDGLPSLPLAPRRLLFEVLSEIGATK